MNIVRSSSGLVVLFLFLIVVAGGMWWWPRPVQFLRDYTGFRAPQNDQYNNPSAQYYKELEQRYAEDTYGGSTPEETLALFITALEAGNIDLASKYFVVEKQEEWRENFDKTQQNNLLEAMITDLQNLDDKYSLNDKQFIFEAHNVKKELVLQVVIAQILNGKWKISSL